MGVGEPMGFLPAPSRPERITRWVVQLYWKFRYYWMAHPVGDKIVPPPDEITRRH